jgi:putative restriction endonuclease
MKDYPNQLTLLNLQKNSNQWPKETKHCAPYKPILLLVVFDLIAENTISNNLIELTPQLGDLFSSYWSLIRPVMPPERSLGNIALPFYHLRNDGFWHLIPKPGQETVVESGVPMRSIRQLQENTLGARFDEALFDLLQQTTFREQLRKTIIETYFDAILQPVLLEQAVFNFESYLYQREIERQAEASDFQLVKPESEDKPARSQGFRRAIVVAYDYICATCGIRVLTNDGQTIVVAAHIVPHYQSHNDDPRNGVALCQSCHWAFDRGMMTIVPDRFTVKLSPQLRNADLMVGYFGNLRGKTIVLPRSEKMYPHEIALDWHLKNIFVS